MNMMSDYNLKLKAIGEEPKLDFERYRFLLTSVESTTKEKIKFDQEKISIELNIKNINEESNKLFKDILERKDKITLIEEELDSLILQENELVKIESELNKINSEITLLENDKLFLSEQNTRLDDANKRIELKTEEVNVLEKEIKELTNKVEGLKMLKDAFGSTGIQDILIEWSLPKLEDKINEALSKTSDFRITLSTQKDNITDGSAKDGLFITVINDVGEEMEYDNYSGGEKVKIKASISEGLASLSKFGFRLLDELFISLDDESSEKFIEVATNLKEEVSQLLVISHLPAVKDIFEDKIIIVKANGISKIIK
jgi:DNA repair exonuclease SbcCD ATPase subunit